MMTISILYLFNKALSHAKYVIDCLKKDKIVFVEKPLALTHKDIDLISEACENNSKLMIRIQSKIFLFSAKG